MILKKASLVASVLLLAQGAIADVAPRSVLVEGQATISAAPDRAYVSMSIQLRNKDMKTARAGVVKVAESLLSYAKRIGIDAASIQSSGLTIYPEYRRNNESGRQELLGYLVQRQFNVTLKDLDKLGDLLEGAIDMGVNQVTPPKLLSSRERELHRQALAAAAKDAEENARLLAETLGSILGPVREITSMDEAGSPPILRQSMMAESAPAGTYAVGQIQVQARVTAKFDLLGQ